MNKGEIVLTVEGLKKLEDELNYLKSVIRREVAEKIKHARGFGDLSENAEYDEAKNEQANVEIRIAEIENMLKNAQVIDEDEVNTDKVSVGAKVKLHDIEYDEEIDYHLVGSTEANPNENKVSNNSPLGKALLGAKVNDIIEVEAPAGIIKYKVLKIDK